MKVMKYIVLLLSVQLYCGCNSWLDVKPSTQKEKEDFYSAQSGFEGGLTGCYMKLKSSTLYGQYLTMGVIEYPAQMWKPYESNGEEMADFVWTSTIGEAYLKSWYSQFYNIIAQVNDLLAQWEKHGNVIEDPALRNMIKGEALAIRAFCHFDLLRLYGQLPQGATVTKRLPYAEVAGEKEVKFLDFETYKNRVLRDFETAAALLKENDPITQYSFAELDDVDKALNNGIISDNFQANRRIRFNYWGVKALQARCYLYFGDKEQAFACAKEVIDATLPNGEKVIDFTCMDDFLAGYYTLPHESLINLNIQKLNSYVPGLFISTNGSKIQFYSTKEEHVLNTLFGGQTDYRYATLKIDFPEGTSGHRYTTKKYWQTTTIGGTVSEGFDLNYQNVPLIRLAEVYLIAVEAASDPVVAENLFRTFKDSRGRNYDKDMEKNSLQDELLNEYRRELIGEGQIFFTYKRLNKHEMPYFTDAETVAMKAVSEENYLLPIPNTEVEY